MIELIGIRQCSVCSRELPATDFYKNRCLKDGLHSECKSCTREYKEQWYPRHRARHLGLMKECWTRNGHEWRRKEREWAATHPNEAEERHARHIGAHRQWYRQHREECAVRSKQWRDANPSKVRALSVANNVKRRERQRATAHEVIDPFEIFKRDKWRCRLCGYSTPTELRGTTQSNAPELDHIIPVVLGGPHTRRNLQCLCRSCNSAKADKYVGQLAFV